MRSEPPNHRVQRTHSRVTPLAEKRKRRATRRAADAGRYATLAHLARIPVEGYTVVVGVANFSAAYRS